MNYRVEVAILFQDKTWDTVFLDVESDDEKSAKEKAEETIRQHSRDTVSHITSVFIQAI